MWISTSSGRLRVALATILIVLCSDEECPGGDDRPLGELDRLGAGQGDLVVSNIVETAPRGLARVRHGCTPVGLLSGWTASPSEATLSASRRMASRRISNRSNGWAP